MICVGGWKTEDRRQKAEDRIKTKEEGGRRKEAQKELIQGS